jgi:glutamate dehydrogenase (NADP+)
VLKAAKILYAPSKAANAGGVAVSDLEMSQNSARIPWKEAELQKMLSDNEWHLPSLRRIWWSRRQQAH